ncbi:MAG: hypothetical protein ACKV19_01255 [Verrucomicrobiales bacterium]
MEKERETWTVKEVSRRPFNMPPPVEVAVPPPIVAPEPEKLGTFLLDAPMPTGPVSDVRAFGFDDRGHIGFLRGSEHFLLIEESGAALAEVPLKDTGDARLALAWIAGDRWLVTASGHGDATESRAWWIDAGHKSLTEVAGFACPPVESLSGSGDGGFVALTNEWQKYSSTEAVVAFGATGALRWKIEANSGMDAGDFLSPESVTVTSKGEVAVLDVIRHIVVLFDLTGKHLRTVDLKKAWKREPNYPSEISADSDGGFVVGDFNGKPPFVRMTATGRVRAQFSPVFKDGRRADQSGELRVAPNGRMWLANRHSLLRLDDGGKVAAILGQQPVSDSLGVIAAAACDDAGRIAAVDEQSGTVHVFDAKGRRLRVCRPEKGDFAGHAGGAQLAVANDGRIILNPDGDERPGIVFGNDGKRLKHKLRAGWGEWCFRQGAGGMLRLGFEEVTLTDDQGAAQQVITRQPDRRWLDFATSTAVAQDGSFLVQAREGETGTVLNFYGPKGEPQRTMAAPVQGWFQLDGWSGTHLLLGTESECLLCDREGKPLRLLKAPAGSLGRAQFLTRGGREWWVLEFAARTVTRWEVPAVQ